MKKFNNIGLLMALVFAVFGVIGCDDTVKPKDDKAKPTTNDHDHGDHDHGDHDHEAHDHSHEMGPKGGHVVKFDDGKGWAAWDHKDNEDKVIVYLLSADRKQLEGRKVTRAYFVAKSGDQQKEFELTATDANADGVAATFERVDKALLAATHIGTELIVETADGKLHVAIEAHNH